MDKLSHAKEREIRKGLLVTIGDRARLMSRKELYKLIAHNEARAEAEARAFERDYGR